MSQLRRVAYPLVRASSTGHELTWDLIAATLVEVYGDDLAGIERFVTDAAAGWPELAKRWAQERATRGPRQRRPKADPAGLPLDFSPGNERCVEKLGRVPGRATGERYARDGQCDEVALTIGDRSSESQYTPSSTATTPYVTAKPVTQARARASRSAEEVSRRDAILAEWQALGGSTGARSRAVAAEIASRELPLDVILSELRDGRRNGVLYLVGFNRRWSELEHQQRTAPRPHRSGLGSELARRLTG